MATLPKFAREFEPVGALVEAAMEGYVSAVQKGTFPSAEHTFNMSHRQWDAFAAVANGTRGLPDPANYSPAHPRVGAAPTPTRKPMMMRATPRTRDGIEERGSGRELSTRKLRQVTRMTRMMMRWIGPTRGSASLWRLGFPRSLVVWPRRPPFHKTVPIHAGS